MEKALAQTLKIGGGKTPLYTIKGSVKFADIGTILNTAIPYTIAIAGVGLLLMIISAGFTLLTSAGDPKKMEAGKNRLTYALLGFVLVFGAYWIVVILGLMFGVKGISDVFK
jgi:hypothetical protein